MGGREGGNNRPIEILAEHGEQKIYNSWFDSEVWDMRMHFYAEK